MTYKTYTFNILHENIHLVAENKKESNRKEYQQDAISPTKQDRRRARSSTPDHSVRRLTRSKTPEHKTGGITPSTPQPSNKLGSRMQNEHVVRLKSIQLLFHLRLHFAI